RSCSSPRSASACRRSEPTLVGRSLRNAAPGWVLPLCAALRLLDAREDLVGLLPGQLVGRRDDRPKRVPDPRARPPGGVSDRVDPGDLLGRLGQRLAPQAEDVAGAAADLVGLLRGAADRDRHRAAQWPDVGLEVLEVVELAVVVDRAVRGPDRAQDVDELL